MLKASRSSGCVYMAKRRDLGLPDLPASNHGQEDT
jgi:hypothetical protein